MNKLNNSNIIAGLTMGTWKICVAAGKQDANGTLEIIGIGQSCSRGVCGGEPRIDRDSLVMEDLRAACSEAEQMAAVKIHSVYLGVTGDHIHSFNLRSTPPVTSGGHVISEEDVAGVVKDSEIIPLPAELKCIHALRQHFYVDSQTEVNHTVGMPGKPMAVGMHVILGHADRLQNAIRLVRSTQLDVDGMVFGGVASSLAVLTNEHKKQGALVIDIGAGTTEYAIYANGDLQHSGVLMLGGNLVSHALAHGLNIPVSQAERLKQKYGLALAPAASKDQTVSIADKMGNNLKQVKLEQVRPIISTQLAGIFLVIAQKLEMTGLAGCLSAGVFICGGTASTFGIEALAEKILRMKVTISRASGISGLTSANYPDFAAAIGLVKYGALCHCKC